MKPLKVYQKLPRDYLDDLRSDSHNSMFWLCNVKIPINLHNEINKKVLIEISLPNQIARFWTEDFEND